MFKDDKPTEQNCPRKQNENIKCPKSDVLKALDGIEVPYKTLIELRSVLYEVCCSCISENTLNKKR
jgi:hypothetical protein